jgi:hypothetical protein
LQPIIFSFAFLLVAVSSQSMTAISKKINERTAIIETSNFNEKGKFIFLAGHFSAQISLNKAINRISFAFRNLLPHPKSQLPLAKISGLMCSL